MYGNKKVYTIIALVTWKQSHGRFHRKWGRQSPLAKQQSGGLSMSNHLIFILILPRDIYLYRRSPTYAVFTTVDPTTAIFGLCTRNWGIFVLVVDPLQSL